MQEQNSLVDEIRLCLAIGTAGGGAILLVFAVLEYSAPGVDPLLDRAAMMLAAMAFLLASGAASGLYLLRLALRGYRRRAGAAGPADRMLAIAAPAGLMAATILQWLAGF